MIFTPSQFTGERAAKGIVLDPTLSAALAGMKGVVSEYELLELYRLSQTVYICANIRAENVAAVPMRVVDSPAGKPVPNHPIAPIFAAMSNYRDVAMRTELGMFFTGANVTLPQPNFAGQFTRWSDNLRWLNPRIWTRRIELQRGLVGFNISRTPEYSDLENFIPIEQTIYFVGIDLLDDFDAVSPAEVAYNAAMAQNETWQTLKSTMENRAVPATILQAAQGQEAAFRSNPEVPSKLQQLLDRAFRGSRNTAKTLVSPDRLEAVQLQTELDKMALDIISPEERQAIAEAAQVPDVLIRFSGATFENADAAVQFWYRNWLKPRCEWYAQGYSRFFTRWTGQPVYIEPDFTGIIQEDDDTDLINSQVTAGYRDLYSAQQMTGVKPDERLKGVYIWNGTPTRIETLVAEPVLPAAPANNIIPYIPQDVFKEIEIATRKGTAFTAKALPAHTAAYILTLVQAGVDRADMITAAKAFYSNAVSAKALQSTRLDFFAEFGDLLARALSDEANSRMFSSGLRAMISRYIDRMFVDGLTDGGVDSTEMDDEDRRTVARLKAEQSAYVTGLLTAIYRDGKVTADEAEVKPELWFNKSLMPAFNAGLESAAANVLMEFGGDDGDESCPDCQTLKGQIHRYKAWKGRNLVPPTDATQCKGFRCNHRLIPAPGQKAQGNWIATKKSHGEADHATA
jgi:hypothetical protein